MRISHYNNRIITNFEFVRAILGISVARLIEDRIIQIVGMIDPSRMGYDAPAMIAVSCQPPMLESVAKTVTSFLVQPH